jgi:calcineurin-like phosphoesterase family protein
MNNLTLKLDSPENVWLTGCTHWGHANILGFCNRPYKTVEEMNVDLIKNWNETVPENGTVIHHGDLTLGGPP